MTTPEALRELGVREDTLTEEEKRHLDERGYLVLPGVLDGAQLEGFRRRVAELLREEGEKAGLEVHQEAGTDRLADLVNKDPMFDIGFTHPRVLAAIARVLGPEFHFSSFNYRAALPGDGHQHLHCDLDTPDEGGGFLACNSIWLLDDFTPDNGATRLVPGSQRWRQTPQQALGDPGAPHPDEILLVAPAGTVCVFNAHTWHGGTRNQTPSPRRAMHAFFGRRDQPQQLDQKKYARPETLARLSPAAKHILDV